MSRTPLNTHRRTRIFFGLLLAAFVTLAAVYVAVIPPFEGPDEYAHLTYVGYLRQAQALPRLDAAHAHISHQLVQQPPLFYGLTALLVGGLRVDHSLAAGVVNPYLAKSLSHRAYLDLPQTTRADFAALYAARLVSLLGAALAVMGTWLAVRRLLPQQRWAAYVAAAVVGFNPQFLFSAGTVTNDTWATALPVWAVWLALGADHAAMSPAATVRRWAGVGALVGLAGLTKYSSLVVVAPLGLIGLAQTVRVALPAGGSRLQARLRYATLGTLAALLGFAVVAGWWSARHRWMTGAALPPATLVGLQPRMARPFPLGWADAALWDGVRWLRASYWGVFGYGILAPAAFYGVTWVMMQTAAVGWGLLAVRAWFSPRLRPWVALGVGAVWFGATLAALVNWMRFMQFTDQGRLLFPAAPAVALLLTLGWAAWLPQRSHRWAAGVAVALLVMLGVSQVFTLSDAYALPRPLAAPPAPDRPIQARFDDGMTLLGVDFPNGAAVAPDAPLSFTLYWITDASIPANDTLFIHLADDADRLLGQFDGVPFGGRHPTRQWRPGAVFADTYTLPAPHQLTDGLATLSLGFYPFDDPAHRLPVHALGDGAPLGDRLVLAAVRVHGDAETPRLAPAPVARWGNGIELAAAAVTLDAQDAPQTVTLRWQTTATIQRDYTVFVQALDADRRVVAQTDRPPQGGAYPTSTWRRGDSIDDVVTLPSSDGDWRQVIVGLYDASGTVLPVVAPVVGEYVTVRGR